MLQFPLKLEKSANCEFSLQVFAEEVGGEGGAAAGCLQGVSCGRAVAVSHAHTGLRTNDALDLWLPCQTEWRCTIGLFMPSINGSTEIVTYLNWMPLGDTFAWASSVCCYTVLLLAIIQSGALNILKHKDFFCSILIVSVCVISVVPRCAADRGLTCSNSSRSTSPSPFKSNILKAISKFLWGAGHHRTQTHHQINTMKNTTTCKHNRGSTKTTV